MFTERTSVGLDVHARSVVAAALDTTTGVIKTARLTPSPAEVIGWVRALPGPAAVCYEAGPTGYGLARACTAAGVRCVVAAPSKIARPAGDRVKTDAKDALLLARLLRMDELTAVRVPTEAEEAARDLVRAREDARAALMAARHRLSKLLLRHGYLYRGGVAWTAAHERWLRSIRFDRAGPRQRSTPAWKRSCSLPDAGTSSIARSPRSPPAASSPPRWPGCVACAGSPP